MLHRLPFSAVLIKLMSKCFPTGDLSLIPYAVVLLVFSNIALFSTYVATSGVTSMIFAFKRRFNSSFNSSSDFLSMPEISI